MQTVKQQFEPQRAGWKRVIYSCVFAAGITLNHTKSLHLLGMLSVWGQNKSVRVDFFPPLFIFHNSRAKTKRELPNQIQMSYLCLPHRWGNAGGVRWGAWLMAVVGGEQKVFFPFSFQEASINTPLVTAPRGTGAQNLIQMYWNLFNLMQCRDRSVPDTEFLASGQPFHITWAGGL